MGRPTIERKGKAIKLRITEEMYEELEKRGSISSVVREMIENELQSVPQKTRERKIEKINNVPQNSEVIEDLKRMCDLSGLSYEGFLEKIDELFNEGFIYVEGVTVKTKGKYDLSRLEEMCHRGNLDVQDVIDRLVSRLTR